MAAIALTVATWPRPALPHWAALSLFGTVILLSLKLPSSALLIIEAIHVVAPLLIVFSRNRVDAVVYCLAILGSVAVVPMICDHPQHFDIHSHASVLATVALCGVALWLRSWRQDSLLKTAAMEQLPAEVIITDAERRIVYANRIVSRTYGLHKHEIYGRTPKLFASGETPPEVYAEMWQALLSDRTWSGTLLNRDHAGEALWTEISMAPVHDRASAPPIGFAAVRTNVTEHVKREHQLMAAWNEAAAASRLKSDFLGHMSHELRTPLNAVIGFSETLLLGIAGPLSDKQSDYIDSIQTAARHLWSLIDDVLDMSKIEAGKVDIDKAAFRITDALDEALGMVRPLAEARRIDLRADCPTVRAWLDRKRSLQILVNLLSNAVKYTPEGGRVAVTVARYGGQGLSIAISDTGIGIAEDEIKLVLTPFGRSPQVANDGNGTGLGLPIAKRLTELQGGSLWLTSRIGEGTTVLLKFPDACVDPA